MTTSSSMRSVIIQQDEPDHINGEGTTAEVAAEDSDRHMEVAPSWGVFVGDLDIDEFNRIRVFLNSSHDPHEEELELSLYADQVTFTTYSAGEQGVRCTVSYHRLAQILSGEVLLQAHVEELNKS